MTEFVLPWPPSVNHYWRLGRGRFFVSASGRKYKSDVKRLVAETSPVRMSGAVRLEIEAHPPDRRRRDLDNIQKAMWDALKDAGVYDDDSQVKAVHAEMREPVNGGFVVVRVEEICE